MKLYKKIFCFLSVIMDIGYLIYSMTEIETFRDKIMFSYRLESHMGCCMTVDKCQKRCNGINLCVSFFYNSNSSQCQLHSVLLSDVNTAKVEMGWKYYSIQKDIKPRDCEDLHRMGVEINGAHAIYRNESYSFKVYCDMKTQRGGWTVFQRRFDGSVDFYRGWNDYVHGFGNTSGEFWLGLEHIHQLTSAGKYELRFDLEDFLGVWKYAIYSPITISDASTKYIINFDKYRGTAGDALTKHKGLPFGTFENHHCAVSFLGAWWYKNCHDSNLNGNYNNTAAGKGLNWRQWHGERYSLKSTEMKIRKI